MKSTDEYRVGFMALLRWILVEERKLSPESADHLLEAYPVILARGVLGGHFTLRETALELELAAIDGELPAETNEAGNVGEIWLAQE